MNGRIYNGGYMEEENNGLRSIERSKLSGAKSRKSRSSGTKKVRETIQPPRLSSGRKNRKTKRFVVFGIAVLGIVVFLVSTTFATGSLVLTLMSADLTVDGVFSAIREPAHSADISYSVRGPYTEIGEATITNITRDNENTRASGTITVYNAHTAGERLNLVNRTRFQTESGTIYRLIGRQIIPGGKMVNGTFVPGKKEVKIEADDFGNEYNLPEKGVRFTIPGLAKYKAFSDSYAVSETKVVGGFSGERFIPDREEESATRERLQSEIEKKLRSDLAQTLETNSLSEQVVFDNGVFIEYESLENEQTADGVVVREKGTLRAISFREAELAALLSQFAEVGIPDTVHPTNVDTGNLTIDVEKDEDFNIASSKEFNVRISGVAKLFWSIDKVLFLSDIAGKKRADVDEFIIHEYPQVTRIDVFSIFPAWRTTLPSNREKISVEVRYGSDN